MMIFFIGFLALVSTQTLYPVNAKEYIFDFVQIKEAPKAPINDVFSLQRRPPYLYRYKRTVDKLLINATVTSIGTGDVYNGKLINVCEKQEAGSWASAVVKIFKLILFPHDGTRHSCPIKPLGGEVYERYRPVTASINATLRGFTILAHLHQFSYTAQTDNDTIILSSLIVQAILA